MRRIYREQMLGKDFPGFSNSPFLLVFYIDTFLNFMNLRMFVSNFISRRGLSINRFFVFVLIIYLLIVHLLVLLVILCDGLTVQYDQNI